MSQFEAALDDYRQKYPQITVRDKITGTGRRIITEKGPDGITHKCFIHENRNSKARVRLQQRYHQRKRFSVLDHLQNPTRFVEKLFQQGVPAVIASDDYGTVVITNRPECIKPSQQHKLLKIETNHRGYNYDVESISEEQFNQLQQQLDSFSI